MTTEQPGNFRIHAQRPAPGTQNGETEDPPQSEAALVRGPEAAEEVTGQARQRVRAG